MKPTKFQNIYEAEKGRRKSLYTINFAPGKRVYDEFLVRENDIEYREWNPQKSKFAAAILKNINQIGLSENDVVLYLGASTGTTVSHVSDIIGNNGFIFAIDSAPRVMRELVFVAEQRKNIAPLLADANKPDGYIDKISSVDFIYQDIAQKNQAEIFLKNCRIFLKKEGFAFFCVKARSIDVTKKPRIIFNEVRNQIEKELAVVDYRKLEPFQKDHCVFVCKKK